MNIFTNNLTKGTNKLLLASVLLINLSAQAIEKMEIQERTAFMIEKNTEQVHQQLSQTLNSDIQFSVASTLPLQMPTSMSTEVLLAKTTAKAKNRKNKDHGE